MGAAQSADPSAAAAGGNVRQQRGDGNKGVLGAGGGGAAPASSEARSWGSRLRPPAAGNGDGPVVRVYEEGPDGALVRTPLEEPGAADAAPRTLLTPPVSFPGAW
eukprot:364095-Chlamydomonas_euryale.AAC.2